MGVEPTTSCVPRKRSSQLSYSPEGSLKVSAHCHTRPVQMWNRVERVTSGGAATGTIARHMDDGYEVQAIERKWQQHWRDAATYQVENDDPRPPFYVLSMYPYPSGPAHMGHVRNYTFGDLIVRHRTMNGYGVLSPIGFDSFGLPAENAAIKSGEHPRPFTDARIEELSSSLQRIGAVYDWRRIVKSHDPVFINWTQWIFLRF